MGSKTRGNSQLPNRLSIPDRATLLTTVGTREGELVLQNDIGLLYTWTETQGVDNGGTIINVDTGSWLAKYSGAVNPKWFGAVCDGITDDSAVLTSMATLFGTLTIFENMALTTVTLDVPIYFNQGGCFTSLTASTVTLTDRIESSNQFIFRGDGNYSLGHDADSGENIREVHASWFGAFTSSTHGADQAPMINKAFASVGNARESIVHFDIGNYNISSQIQVTRGGWVKGAGTRRTVFKLDTDGFGVFITTEQACKFSEIQFELHTSILSDRTSPYIILDHNDCTIKDVALTIGAKGIVSNGNGTVIDDVFCLYSGDHGAGSSMIEINGSNTSIRNIKNNSSITGNESVINIGENAGAISGITIENIKSISSSQTVRINAKGGNITRVIIKDVLYNGYAGTNPDWVIKVINSLGYNIDNIAISGVVGSSYANGCISLESIANTISDITINDVTFQGTTGIELRETSGTLKEIFIGATVNINDCTNPYVKIGVPTEIKINPMAMFPLVNPSYSYDVTIADDNVYSIDLGTDIYTGTVTVTAGYTNYGIYSIRSAGTPGNILIIGSANMNASVGVLTGITGVDTKITVSADDNGLIYVENRSGVSQRVCITVNVGIIA